MYKVFFLYVNFEEIRREWRKNPKFIKAQEESEAEYQIACQIIGARIEKKMSQKELAAKSDSSQAAISKLENMEGQPSFRLLKKVARALKSKITVTVA